MSQFNIISATSESTVVAEYTPDACRSDSYQSEAALEQEFLRLLCAQGYEYLEIHDEAALIEPLTIALAAAEQAHISYGKSVAIMGAGGIGQELMTNIKLDRYDQVSITLLLIILVVSALDMLSGRLRLWVLEGKK